MDAAASKNMHRRVFLPPKNIFQVMEGKLLFFVDTCPDQIPGHMQLQLSSICSEQTTENFVRDKNITPPLLTFVICSWVHVRGCIYSTEIDGPCEDSREGLNYL